MSILQQVAKGLTVGKCDGKATLAQARSVFTAGVDPDFKGWGLDRANGATPATNVAVYEMVNDATFAEMFGSLSRNTSKLCLTQAQIIEFVKEHRKHLRQGGYATFFLFQVGGKFFVASVFLDDDGPLVIVYHFEGDGEWYGGRRRRVVVPQL